MNHFFFSIPTNVLDVMEDVGEEYNTHFSFEGMIIKENTAEGTVEQSYQGIDGLKSFICKYKKLLEENLEKKLKLKEVIEDRDEQNIVILESFIEELE